MRVIKELEPFETRIDCPVCDLKLCYNTLDDPKQAFFYYSKEHKNYQSIVTYIVCPGCKSYIKTVDEKIERIV